MCNPMQSKQKVCPHEVTMGIHIGDRLQMGHLVLESQPSDRRYLFSKASVDFLVWIAILVVRVGNDVGSLFGLNCWKPV